MTLEGLRERAVASKAHRQRYTQDRELIITKQLLSQHEPMSKNIRFWTMSHEVGEAS
jgi:hypothetical protein